MAVSATKSGSDGDGMSLVIPLYNEEESVADTLDRLRDLRPGLPSPCEIILVNDGSTDRTAELLAELVKPEDELTILHHTTNRGYGAALKTGIRRSQQPWVAIADADGTYPLDRLRDLYDHALENDLAMVVGSRTGPLVVEPPLRRPAKWVLRMLASSLSGTPIPDLNSGLRVFRREPLVRYLDLLPNGFSFTTTITLALLSKAYPLDYIPINLYKRAGVSTIRPIYDTLNFLQLICRTILWLNPLRIFLPLGCGFIVLGIVVLFSSWHYLGRPLDVTTGLLIQTGVIILAVGMLADLIDKRSR